MHDIARTTATAYHAYHIWHEVWHDHDADAVVRWWEPDGYAHIQTAYPTPFPGNREQARQEIGAMLSAFTGEWEGDVYAAQDDCATIDWIFEGRHTGTWRRLRATQRDVYFMGVDLIRIRNGRVTEFNRVIDQEFDLLFDLGYRIEPPGVGDLAAENMATTTIATVASPETR